MVLGAVAVHLRHSVQDHSQHRHTAEFLARVLRQVKGGGSRLNHEQNSIASASNQSCVRYRLDWRRVNNDPVEQRRHALDQLPKSAVGDQFAGIGNRVSAGNEDKVLHWATLEDFPQFVLIAGEIVGQPGFGRKPPGTREDGACADQRRIGDAQRRAAAPERAPG